MLQIPCHYPWIAQARGFTPSDIPLPPVCENNTLVGATVGVVSAAFGILEFGGSIFWWSMKIMFFR